MREYCSRELCELYLPNEEMFPFKTRSYLHDYPPEQRNARRMNEHESDAIDGACVEQSAFNELSRKVDWLIDEVRNLKQIISVYEHRMLETNTYDRRREDRHYETRSDEFLLERRLNADLPNRQLEQHRSLHEERRYFEVASVNDDRDLKKISLHQIETSERNNFENTTRSQRVRTYPYELLSRSDHESLCSSESTASISLKTERKASTSRDVVNTGLQFAIPIDINIAEIIFLWQRGLNDIPPVVNWTTEQKLRHQDIVEKWFRIYNLFTYSCSGDIGRFIARFTDTSGKMMHPLHVASLCPDVDAAFNVFLQSKEPEETAENQAEEEKLFLLPRKINGRKVSAKDVIQLWEEGMGDIPPIKSWTKVQKFKQQSKISRWKKIVDIYKYQCKGDMRKFEEIYSDIHGCLLPVAAITSKFETIYGDELNITSKLMTVSTNQDTFSLHDIRKRTHSSDDGLENPMKKHIGNENASHHFSLIRKSPSSSVMISEKNHEEFVESDKVSTAKESLTSIKTEESELTTQVSFPPNECRSPTIVFEQPTSPSNQSESDSVDSSKRLLEIYVIPENSSLHDMIVFWEKGSEDFPPIKTWSAQQKLSQKELIASLEKIYFLYSVIFNYDINALLRESAYTDQSDMSLADVLSQFSQILKEHFPAETLDSITPTGEGGSMTFDFSHHKTIAQSTDLLYLLPRKINGRKVNAKDVLQLWYHGLNKIPAVKQWSPQQKAVQQSKISRWKKIVDLFEQDFSGDWIKFEKHFSTSLGQMLPITAIIAKHEDECKTGGGSSVTNLFHTP